MQNVNGVPTPRSLSDIKFPKFNPEQLEFFQQMIELTREDRLQLEPRKADFELFQLQWNGLESMEATYKWLIAGHFAIVNAEVEERVGQGTYDPQQKLEESSGVGQSTGVENNNVTF
jgi:hypothetical protein